MKNIKSHFVFNRSQQNGIFLLVLIIIVLQLVYFFYPFSSEVVEGREQQKVVEELQRSVDSLKSIAAEKGTFELQPFNPNLISDYKGYTLGMSVEEIDRLLAFREKGLWVNSSEEFREVTGVSDSLLKKIAPYFKFPEWKKKEISNKDIPKNTLSTPRKKQDLNAASTEELQVINGIGEKLSERIVKYRSKIGGFRSSLQLEDVYGLSPEVIERLNRAFEVRSIPQEKLSLNSITVLDLSEIPYFNYELARSIITYRQNRGTISSFEELEHIKGFPVDKIERIKLYLAID
ncbi:ComEA family DNA-binding protein [Salinimicrobium gaetbulicola]|uniref:ComEA family DNA-binding protein n=1 Tax=Salinimicrobium gaetbulicola TaxID=999702 RepID=A0ABW3IEV1_9FLAO